MNMVDTRERREVRWHFSEMFGCCSIFLSLWVAVLTLVGVIVTGPGWPQVAAVILVPLGWTASILIWKRHPQTPVSYMLAGICVSTLPFVVVGNVSIRSAQDYVLVINRQRVVHEGRVLLSRFYHRDVRKIPKQVHVSRGATGLVESEKPVTCGLTVDAVVYVSNDVAIDIVSQHAEPQEWLESELANTLPKFFFEALGEATEDPKTNVFSDEIQKQLGKETFAGLCEDFKKRFGLNLVGSAQVENLRYQDAAY